MQRVVSAGGSFPALAGFRLPLEGFLGGDRFFVVDGGGLHHGAAGGFALEAFEVGAEIGSVLIAEVAVFFEGFVDDAFEFGRDFRVEANRCGRVSMENAVEYRGRSVALEREGSGGHFVENRSEREKIGPNVERFPERLLGRHVSDCADRAAGPVR